jgi:type I restriction enzyme S subunit
MMIVRQHPSFDSHWLCWMMNSQHGRRQVEHVQYGTAQKQFNISHAVDFLYPVPPLPEQRAIAEALGDVDGLRDGLDRLIAKKRDLKQAAMQQLLTGQTRLPGFHGGWEMTRLDALADIRSGGTPSTAEPRFWDGDIPWCTPTDITALNGHKYLGETARMITQLGLKASSAEMIPAHSVVMTSRATIGECAINTVPVSTNQGFKNFVPLAATDVDFLYYLLGTQKQGFISLCGGSTFLEISKTQLAAYKVRLPSTKAEQTAIAEVLTDMDGELAVLEQRREKTRALKQAMMQELLTGRIRLV